MMTLNGTASAVHNPTTSQASLWALSLGSLGVVYGDIGTSPLYAFREAITSAGGSADGVDPNAVLSVLSLILWALILIVTVKYVLLLLRADNNGEGGTLTLMALAQRAMGGNAPVLFLLGVISAALFYGDAVITPAISVLSAIEGLKLATSGIEPYIVPITLVILVALFLAQSKGTAKVSALFGPIMTVWFIAIALPGFYYIAVNPGILAAVNPFYGINFFLSHGKVAFITLGAVFLAVTGAEALYADLGHFGKRPIQFAWVALVLPSLAINYFGQGAMILSYPKGIENPFFLMYPDWALLPMVALAAAATIIASQAVMTGAY
jgi:KUP system potassium uptake protein